MVALLQEYLEARLPRALHEDLERHLSQCPRCLSFLRTYESTVSLLQSLTEDDLPPELRVSLHAFIDKQKKN